MRFCIIRIFQVVIFNCGFLWMEKALNKLDEEILSKSWTVNATTRQTGRKILKECTYATYVVVFNSALGVFAGFVLYPVGVEQEYHFPIYFFRKCTPDFHYVFEFLYFLTFPVSAYLMCNLVNFVTYYTHHVVTQIRLGKDTIDTVCSGYEDRDDDELYNSEEYQSTIRQRLRFLIIRQSDFLR